MQKKHEVAVGGLGLNGKDLEGGSGSVGLDELAPGVLEAEVVGDGENQSVRRLRRGGEGRRMSMRETKWASDEQHATGGEKQAAANEQRAAVGVRRAAVGALRAAVGALRAAVGALRVAA
ncbi:hypothetical protein Cni_G03167 [Canna indica]|uniref:Uncharacterized protein n=1 Tax=Canna indica TaxID=4628 RepID=A0AAQ3Q2U3_9LILI|nr:hypothetical protein Cni_G03167 [Canna indica]